MPLTFNRFKTKTSLLFYCFLAAISLLLTACKAEKPLNHVEKIKHAGSIKVGMLYGPTTYYINKDGATGFEYELVEGFADYMGVELEVITAYSINEVLPRLERNEVDFAAGSFGITEQRRKKFRFAPPYQIIDQLLVFKQGKKWPRTIADLEGSLMVTAESTHAEHLTNLSSHISNLNWQTTSEHDVEELMQAVLSEEIDYTIVNSNHLAINRRVYPDLSTAFTLTRGEEIAWAFSHSHDDSLYALFIDYFGKLNQNGELAILEDRYFGHVRQFNYVDTRAFLKAIETKLPKFQGWFEQYAKQYSLDWRLLAALSYQESHWNPKARSKTGVRGIMMLTRPTAKQVGVKNRLEPEQNIKGGARYFASLLSRIPARIKDPDRTWFALAAYNLGLGHLEDARKLTQADGANPDNWIEVKKRLPWLHKKRHYKKTRYGFARGREAVAYVANIRRFYDSLLWLDKAAKLTPMLNKGRLAHELSMIEEEKAAKTSNKSAGSASEE